VELDLSRLSWPQTGNDQRDPLEDPGEDEDQKGHRCKEEQNPHLGSRSPGGASLGLETVVLTRPFS